jgi:dihydroneopterin aldolase
MSEREDAAAMYFNCTTKERATFESGIKLGAIYHQFVGTPVSAMNAESLERAIEEGVKVQPFVHDVQVHIDRSHLRQKRDQFDYQTLTGNMLQVRLTIQIEKVRVVTELRYLENLNYPLMFVSMVTED